MVWFGSVRVRFDLVWFGLVWYVRFGFVSFFLFVFSFSFFQVSLKNFPIRKRGMTVRDKGGGFVFYELPVRLYDS